MEGQDKEDRGGRGEQKHQVPQCVQTETVRWAVSKEQEWGSIYVSASGFK